MDGMAPRIDPVAMRRTLGRFTTGVTVVTTASGGDVHAMTADAVTAVSLDPPLVLVSGAPRPVVPSPPAVRSRVGRPPPPLARFAAGPPPLRRVRARLRSGAGGVAL